MDTSRQEIKRKFEEEKRRKIEILTRWKRWIEDIEEGLM